jgi:hypothetical protein
MIYISIFIFCIVLVFIINNNNNNNNEYFQSNYEYSLGNNINVKLYNIEKYGNSLYYYDDSSPKICSKDIDCNNNEVCKEYNSESICHKKFTGEIFNLISSNKSYIEIPKLNPASINISFIVLFNNTNKKCILRSANNLWALIYDNDSLILNSYENKKIYVTKILKKNINVDVIYNIDIMVNISQLIVKINDDKDVMIKFGTNSCYLDNDCNYGRCELSSGNICSYYEESLIFGKGISFITDVDYFDGFIGNIKINNYTVQKDKCLFNNKQYVLKSKCINDCNKENCTDCDKKCSNILCDFNPIGTKNFDDCIIKCNINCNVGDSKTINTMCKKMCNSCNYFPCKEEPKNDIIVPKSTQLIVNYISSNGKKVIIKWKSINDIKHPIQGYLLFISKTLTKNDYLNIKKITNLFCSDYCEFLIEDLDPNETYTIFIKGFNTNGIGIKSNSVTFKSGVKRINKDISLPDLNIGKIREETLIKCNSESK